MHYDRVQAVCLRHGAIVHLLRSGAAFDRNSMQLVDAGGDELASRRQCHRLASRLEVSPPALSIGAVTLVWVPVQKYGLLSNAPHSSGGIVSVAL